MSYVTYTAAGPFINDNPPAINATVLNSIETFLSAGWFDSAITSDGSGNHSANSYASPFSKINASATTISGSTSGTASLYQPWQGTIKLVLVTLNGFRNGGGSAQNIALPAAFTVGCYWWSSATNTFSLTSSGTAQSCNVVTGLGSGTGGSSTSETLIGSFNNGDCPHAFDAVSLVGSAASAHTGWIVALGV